MHIQTFQILTQICLCALNGCSGAVPTHSLAFTCTHKCSRDVQYSLIDVHLHSRVFKKCSIHVWHVHVPEGPMNMFSNLQSTQMSYKFGLNFCWMPFLWLRQTRSLDVTLEYVIDRWSWFPPMRLATKNKKVVQKFWKFDISQYYLIKRLISLCRNQLKPLPA